MRNDLLPPAESSHYVQIFLSLSSESDLAKNSRRMSKRLPLSSRQYRDFAPSFFLDDKPLETFPFNGPVREEAQNPIGYLYQRLAIRFRYSFLSFLGRPISKQLLSSEDRQSLHSLRPSLSSPSGPSPCVGMPILIETNEGRCFFFKRTTMTRSIEAGVTQTLPHTFSPPNLLMKIGMSYPHAPSASLEAGFEFPHHCK